MKALELTKISNQKSASLVSKKLDEKVLKTIKGGTLGKVAENELDPL